MRKQQKIEKRVTEVINELSKASNILQLDVFYSLEDRKLAGYMTGKDLEMRQNLTLVHAHIWEGINRLREIAP